MAIKQLNLEPSNPFNAPSRLPYSLPDFNVIRFEHYEPAIRAGLVAERAEIDAIVNNPELPTVENTLVPFDCGGELLNRALTVFYNISSADTSNEIDDLDEELAPELSAHHDAIYMNHALYQRFLDLKQRIDTGEVPADQEARWLLHTTLQDFKRAGVALDEAAQEELRTLNAQLTELSTRFDRKVLAGANEAGLFVEKRDELDGLSDDAIDTAAVAAKQRGCEGQYLLELRSPTQQPALASLKNRAVRERLFNASINRGLRGGDNDTRAVILEIVRLRARFAQLLGYEHYAAYVAEDSTARNSTAVTTMLSKLAPAAVRNAHKERAILEQALREDLGDPTATLAPWDWQYYAERVKHEKFSIDDSVLRPYFELDNVVENGVFAAAGKLYGLTFTRRDDLVGYNEDVRVYEVFNEDGSGLGLFLGDYYTRDSKRGGAWMNNLVDQAHLTHQQAVVVNNLNISKPAPGQPTLLTWDEVITLFHEFGHALHGLFSNVEFPSHSGTEVSRDFVEFPSQVNEMWAWEPQILQQYARHFETGERIPSQWIDTLIASRQFNEGFNTTEYLAAAILDQAWHTLKPEDVPTDPESVETFERQALEAAGIYMEEVPTRYRTPYFSHIFGGGYAAAYYSYIWSEVLDADTVQWFSENGGLKRENGEQFRSRLLSRGGSQDPMASYLEFRGTEPDVNALLKRRGLDSTAE